MCPTCSRSKQPLASTICSPARRHSATRWRSSSRERTLLCSLMESFEFQKLTFTIHDSGGRTSAPGNKPDTRNSELHQWPPAAPPGKRPPCRGGGVGPGSQGGGKSCDHGIAGAGHVHHLVGAVDRNRQRLGVLLKGHHAIAPAGDDQRLQGHLLHQALAGGEQLLIVVSNPDVQRLFHLRLIGSGRRRPPVVENAIARINGNQLVLQAT